MSKKVRSEENPEEVLRTAIVSSIAVDSKISAWKKPGSIIKNMNPQQRQVLKKLKSTHVQDPIRWVLL